MAEFIGGPAASADDGYWDGNGGFDNSDDEAFVVATDFVFETPAKIAFIRAPGVTIDQGTVVSSAKLTLVSTVTKDTSTLSITISCLDEDDSAQIADFSDGDSRPLTDNSEGNFGAISSGVAFDTFDLTVPVQAVIDRGGFSNGNAIQFRIEVGNAVDEIAFATVDHATLAAAILTINYEDGGGGSGGNRRRRAIVTRAA